MTSKNLGLSPELYAYYQSITIRETDLLTQLRRETQDYPGHVMQITPEQGQFMAFLARLMGAKRIVEVGVFTGYSSLCLALTLPPEGILIACDTDPKATTIAQRYWQAAGVDDRVQLHLGPGVDTLTHLLEQGQGDSFDLMFIDADKRNYDRYYELGLQLLRPGGVILIDNIFWDGYVADPTMTDAQTQAIRALNAKLIQDDRIDVSVLPLADGLTLARKR